MNIARFSKFVLLPLLAVLLGACASRRPVPTGFLSDYSKLQPDGPARAVHFSPKLAAYSSFIVDPVRLGAGEGKLTLAQREEVTSYMHDSIVKVYTSRGYRVVSHSGRDTARVRMAITDLKKSTWWLNLYWATKLSGLGTGGAAMEGEIIDSRSGDQLAAVIDAGRGNQFELDTFSALDDVKDVIDRWVKKAGERMDRLRRSQ